MSPPRAPKRAPKRRAPDTPSPADSDSNYPQPPPAFDHDHLLTMASAVNGSNGMPPFAGLFPPSPNGGMRPPRYPFMTNGEAGVGPLMASPPLRPNEDEALRMAKEQRRARARKVYSSEEEDQEEEEEDDGVYGLVASLKVGWFEWWVVVHNAVQCYLMLGRNTGEELHTINGKVL